MSAIGISVNAVVVLNQFVDTNGRRLTYRRECGI